MFYRLTNDNGMEARFTDFGASWTHMIVPDRRGQLADVLLGFDEADHYRSEHPCLGSTVGRVANRIARGHFRLGDQEFQLPLNEGRHHLHGGPNGLQRVTWKVEASPSQLRMTHLDPDGSNGYPGRLEVEVIFTLTPQNELRIDYRAVCDRDTPINLTNHGYFNLGSQADISDHEVQIFARHYTPVDADCIPTGEIVPVAGSPHDYRLPRRLGQDCCDLNFVVDGDWGQLRPVAQVYEPKSGRRMEVLSDRPGVQFFTGNCLDGSMIGKGGRKYGYRAGLCLETQHFPDALHHPHFPSPVVPAGQEFRSTTVHRFCQEA